MGLDALARVVAELAVHEGGEALTEVVLLGVGGLVGRAHRDGAQRRRGLGRGGCGGLAAAAQLGPVRAATGPARRFVPGRA